MKKILLAVIIAILFTGCAAYNEMVAYKSGTPVSEEQTKSFKVGETTIEDVEQKLGSPQKTEQVGSDIHYIYSYTEMNSGLSGKSDISESTRFIFDENMKKLTKILKGPGLPSSPMGM